MSSKPYQMFKDLIEENEFNENDEITQSNPPDETEKDKSTDEELKVKEEETDEQVEIYLADVMKQLEKEPLFEVYGVSKFNSNSSATFSMLNRKIP
ncbi:12709_t:CDS:2 [Entrophospora sp. SA101]|nr:12709_t:CDS:2 [Entrophospora sp. SA101]